MKYEVLLSKLFRLPLEQALKEYKEYEENNSFTFAEQLRAMDTLETKARFKKRIKEEAFFTLLFTLTQMSIGKTRTVDENLNEIKGYPMVIWMEIIGELEPKKITNILRNYSNDLPSMLVETFIINLPEHMQAMAVEKNKNSLDPKGELFTSFYLCLGEKGKDKVEKLFPEYIQKDHLLELKDLKEKDYCNEIKNKKELLTKTPMDSIVESILLKSNDFNDVLSILEQYSDRIEEISDIRFKLLVGRLVQWSNDSKDKINIFNSLKSKFKQLELKDTLEILEANNSTWTWDFDSLVGDIIYGLLDIAYKEEKVIKYTNEETIKYIVDKFESDCSKKSYTIEDLKELVDKVLTTKPQKLIYDDYMEAMIACRQLMAKHEINNQHPYYLELREKFSKVLNEEVERDGTITEDIDLNTLFYRLVKGTVDFTTVINTKTYKGLCYLTKTNQPTSDCDLITTKLTDEQASKIDISPVLQWKKIKIKEARKEYEEIHHVEGINQTKFNNTFDERIALQLLLLFGENKARHIINSSMRVNRMENIFDPIDYSKINIDENGKPITNEELLEFFFGRGSVKEKNSIINKIIREELVNFDYAIPAISNSYEEIKEACHGVLTVKRIMKHLDEKDLPITLKPNQYTYKRALNELKYLTEDKAKKAVDLCDDAQKRKYSTIPKVKGAVRDFTYEILDLKDPFAVAVGDLSHCCFVIDGITYRDLKHSMQSKNGRTFVVYKNGKFLTHSWVWRNGDVVCFDSVEAGCVNHGELTDKDNLGEVYQQAGEDILRQSSINENEEERVKLVTVGKSDFIFAGLKKLESENLPEPIEPGLAIYDSRVQHILSGEMPKKPRYGEVSAQYKDPRKSVYHILDMDDINVDYLDDALLKFQALKYEATGSEEIEDQTSIGQLLVGDDWYIKTTKDGEIEAEIIGDEEESIQECAQYAKVLGITINKNYNYMDEEQPLTKEDVVKQLKLSKVESRRG